MKGPYFLGLYSQDFLIDFFIATKRILVVNMQMENMAWYFRNLKAMLEIWLLKGKGIVSPEEVAWPKSDMVRKVRSGTFTKKNSLQFIFIFLKNLSWCNKSKNPAGLTH